MWPGSLAHDQLDTPNLIRPQKDLLCGQRALPPTRPSAPCPRLRRCLGGREHYTLADTPNPGIDWPTKGSAP